MRSMNFLSFLKWQNVTMKIMLNNWALQLIFLWSFVIVFLLKVYVVSINLLLANDTLSYVKYDFHVSSHFAFITNVLQLEKGNFKNWCHQAVDFILGNDTILSVSICLSLWNFSLGSSGNFKLEFLIYIIFLIHRPFLF